VAVGGPAHRRSAPRDNAASTDDPGAADPVTVVPSSESRSPISGDHLQPTGAPRPKRSTASLETLEISRRPGAIQRLRHVWQYRELLMNLVRKELKVKYKDSILGFLWSLLNPALQIVVFSFVFGVLFKAAMPKFAIFMICGLLPWTFFTNAISGGCGSIVGNSQLVNKVWFPREILPLASVGAAMVHWFLQSIVLVIALAVVQIGPAASYIWLLIPAILVLVTFSAALGIMLSAINVYLRDTQHLLELVLLAWFWATPIVWGYPQLSNKLVLHGITGNIGLANPVTPIVLTFQRALYHQWVFNGQRTINGYAVDGASVPGTPLWYLRNLAIVGLGAVALLWFALWLFGRLEDNFGEEI
jgi:ABC-2 type transport system permease protein